MSESVRYISVCICRLIPGHHATPIYSTFIHLPSHDDLSCTRAHNKSPFDEAKKKETTQQTSTEYRMNASTFLLLVFSLPSPTFSTFLSFRRRLSIWARFFESWFLSFVHFFPEHDLSVVLLLKWTVKWNYSLHHTNFPPIPNGIFICSTLSSINSERNNKKKHFYEIERNTGKCRKQFGAIIITLIFLPIRTCRA